MNELEDLLTRLEELSAQLADMSDVQAPEGVNAVPLLALIQERGQVIEQLQPVLASHAPVSYMDWNRLVVIHHQGSRISENLRQVRSRIALELGASSSGRLFLERVTGMLSPVLHQG